MIRKGKYILLLILCTLVTVAVAKRQVVKIEYKDGHTEIRNLSNIENMFLDDEVYAEELEDAIETGLFEGGKFLYVYNGHVDKICNEYYPLHNIPIDVVESYNVKYPNQRTLSCVRGNHECVIRLNFDETDKAGRSRISVPAQSSVSWVNRNDSVYHDVQVVDRYTYSRDILGLTGQDLAKYKYSSFYKSASNEFELDLVYYYNNADDQPVVVDQCVSNILPVVDRQDIEVKYLLDKIDRNMMIVNCSDDVKSIAWAIEPLENDINPCQSILKAGKRIDVAGFKKIDLGEINGDANYRVCLLSYNSDGCINGCYDAIINKSDFRSAEFQMSGICQYPYNFIAGGEIDQLQYYMRWDSINTDIMHIEIENWGSGMTLKMEANTAEFADNGLPRLTIKPQATGYTVSTKEIMIADVYTYATEVLGYEEDSDVAKKYKGYSYTDFSECELHPFVAYYTENGAYFLDYEVVCLEGHADYSIAVDNIENRFDFDTEITTVNCEITAGENVESVKLAIVPTTKVNEVQSAMFDGTYDGAVDITPGRNVKYTCCFDGFLGGGFSIIAMSFDETGTPKNRVIQQIESDY